MSIKIYMPWRNLRNYVNPIAHFGEEVCFTEPENCDALLLPGGDDINPALYNQENKGSLDIDDERDSMELDLFRLFAESGKPILGICRGAQLINVALGGSLFQDIPKHSRIENKDRLHHSRTVDDVLIKLYSEEFTINSSHHQAVDCLGKGLKAVQWADDGTIEAIRHKSLPIFAVQWHPERLREPTDGWKLIEWWLETIKTSYKNG